MSEPLPDVQVNTDPLTDKEKVTEFTQKNPLTVWSVTKAVLHSGAQWFVKKPLRNACVCIVFFTVIYVLRNFYQPYLVMARIHALAFVSVIGMSALAYQMMKKRSAFLRSVTTSVACAGVLGIMFVLTPLHTHFSQFLRFETLDFTDLSELPISVSERILPLQAVATEVRDKTTIPAQPSLPDLVRDGVSIKWTTVLEPNTFWNQLVAPITQLISIDAGDPTPNVGANKTDVHFDIGEGLILSRNTDTCVRRGLGFLQLFSYEPSNVLYMKNDKGIYVQVVSLIKWSGVLFPWPDFGGVMVIEQGDTNIFARWFLGCGMYIAPEEMKKHAYLTGQNVVPYEVARFRAKSLRFNSGGSAWSDFWGPLRWNKSNDVVIADVPEDINPLPFVLEFKMPGAEKPKLYQFIAMETSDFNTHGLSASFWHPADGIGPSMVYNHVKKGEFLTGVTAIKDRVVASRRDIIWSGHNTVAEARPYIRAFPDGKGGTKSRLMFLTSIVTSSERKSAQGSENRLIGGAPMIAILDAETNTISWVDVRKPETWDDQILKDLGLKKD
jgi:hypothetical protein